MTVAPDPNAMNLGDWISAGLNVLQGVAIIAAGAFAYYKFIRGRTFHRRAELTADASLLSAASPMLRVKTTLKNTGGANIPLRAKTIRVDSFRQGDTDEKGRPEWREIAHAPAFKDHDWIESVETINDEVVIPLPVLTDDIVALRATCIVYEQRKQRWYKRRRGGGTTWTGKSVVPVGQVDSMKGDSGMANGESFTPDPNVQRDADEREIRDVENRQREASEEEIQRVEDETKDDS